VERACKGMIYIVIARIRDHVFLRVEARLRQQSGKRKWVCRGMGKVRDTARDLARFLLLLKVGTTQKTALLSSSASAFFVRWV
jgi:hypothetical protein